jgi:glycerol kinase
MVKHLYARGVLLHTGTSPIVSPGGVLRTVAWGLGARTAYALEGNSFVAGELMQWLRHGLLWQAPAEASEAVAAEVSDLARLATGAWSSQADIATRWPGEARFIPGMSSERREQLYAEWRRAVERPKGRGSPGTTNS